MKKMFLLALAATTVFVSCNKDEIESLTKQNAHLSAVNSGLENEILSIQAELTASNEASAQLTIQLETANDELVTITASLEASEEALSASDADSAEKAENILGLLADIADLQALIDVANADLASNMEEIAGLESELDDANADLADVKARLATALANQTIVVEEVTVVETTVVTLTEAAQAQIDSAVNAAVAEALSPYVDADGNPLPSGLDISSLNPTVGDWSAIDVSILADQVQTKEFTLTYEGRVYTATDSRTAIYARSGGVSSTVDLDPTITYDGLATLAEAQEAADAANGADVTVQIAISTILNSREDITAVVDSWSFDNIEVASNEFAAAVTGTSVAATGLPTQIAYIANPTVAYDVRTYSDWAPVFGTQTANFTQTRTVTNAGGNFDPAIAEKSLSRLVLVSQTTFVNNAATTSTEAVELDDINGDNDISDTLIRTVDDGITYTATIGVGGISLGSHDVAGTVGAWTIDVDNDPAINASVSVSITIVDPSLLKATVTVNGNALSSGDSIDVEVDDVLAFAWTGGSTGSVNYTVTQADIDAGDFSITLSIPFSTATKN